jgi:hypothetical protein
LNDSIALAHSFFAPSDVLTTDGSAILLGGSTSTSDDGEQAAAANAIDAAAA